MVYAKYILWEYERAHIGHCSGLLRPKRRQFPLPRRFRCIAHTITRWKWLALRFRMWCSASKHSPPRYTTADLNRFRDFSHSCLYVGFRRKNIVQGHDRRVVLQCVDQLSFCYRLIMSPSWCLLILELLLLLLLSTRTRPPPANSLHYLDVAIFFIVQVHKPPSWIPNLYLTYMESGLERT